MDGTADEPTALRSASEVRLDHRVRIANRFRWMFLAVLLLFNNVGLAAEQGVVGSANVLLLLGVALAGYVHYRLGQRRALEVREVLVISAAQDLLITAGVWLTGGYDSHLFVLYYPSLAVLGLVLPLPASVAYASAVGLVYAALSLMGAGGAPAVGTAYVFKVLAERWLALYAVLGVSAWAVRYEQATHGTAEVRAHRLQQTSDELRAAVDALANAWQSTTTTIDPAALARHVEAAAAELDDDCRQIEAVIAELSGRMVQANDNRALAAQASTQVADTARHLATHARPTAVAIERAHAARGRARAVVEGWSARSQGVGELSAAVRKVADQTNLLAFNATIEAIQAGERGRRFAVVADEVRLVAEQAIQMAREIDALSVEMWEGTQQVLDAIDELEDLLGQASALAGLAVQVSEQQQAAAETLVLSADAAGVAALCDAADARAISGALAGQAAAIARLQDAACRLDGWAADLTDNNRMLDGVLSQRGGQSGDTPDLAAQR